MVPGGENMLLKKCLRLIEEKAGWGSSSQWTNSDFESLSDKIQEATGINLSVLTLKRIWGKVKYESKPTVTTLNTLAKFIGFENWRSFVQQSSDLKIPGTNAPALPEYITGGKESKPARSIYLLVGMASIILTGILLIVFFTNSRVKSISTKPADFSFSSKKTVFSGVPNSVIFDYNATAATSGDSIFIQQSWNKLLSRQVSRTEKKHTSIYYYPGFFKAKLVVADKIVKEHNLLITTDGWLPIAEQNPVPVYYKQNDVIHNGVMNLPIEKLNEYNIKMQPETPWISYNNVRDFGNLYTDNFIFEAVVKSDYKEGSGICQHAQIKILGEGNTVSIPLSAKGCVSDLNLFFIDKRISGKINDLSGFGCDLSTWVKARCEIKDKKAQIFINNNLAYTGSFTSDGAKIVGIVFRFQGTGSVTSVKLARTNGEVVYYDEFN